MREHTMMLPIVASFLFVRQTPSIVEVGGPRGAIGSELSVTDGASTMVWLSRTLCQITSLDHDANVAAKADLLLKAADRGTGIHTDALGYLTHLDRAIPALYLDGPGPDDRVDYAQYHLACVESVRRQLTDDAVIAVDDCDIPGGGKGSALPPLLRSMDFMRVISGRVEVWAGKGAIKDMATFKKSVLLQLK
jgi:hypothetical protein